VFAGIGILVATAASGDTIGWWRMDDAGASAGAAIGTTVSEVNAGTLDGTGQSSAAYSADVPGPFIYDPVGDTYKANGFSLDGGAANAKINVANNALLDPDTPDRSFTIEIFLKLTGEPVSYDTSLSRVQNGPTNPDTASDSDRLGWQIDFDSGTAKTTYGQIRSRWDTPGTPPLDYNRTVRAGFVFVDTDTGSGNPADYDDADVYNDGDGTNDASTAIWHHIALTFDAATQVVRIWDNYTQGTSFTLNAAFVHPSAALQFGKFSNSAYGLVVDEVRYSSGVLDSDDFLQATVVPEPSTGLLALLGLAAFGLRRRR